MSQDRAKHIIGNAVIAVDVDGRVMVLDHDVKHDWFDKSETFESIEVNDPPGLYRAELFYHGWKDYEGEYQLDMDFENMQLLYRGSLS